MASSNNKRSRENHAYNADLAVSITTPTDGWEPLDLQHLLGATYCEFTTPQEAYVEFATPQDHERIRREGFPGMTVENWNRDTSAPLPLPNGSSDESPTKKQRTKKQRTKQRWLLVPETQDIIRHELAVFLAVKSDSERNEYQNYFRFLHRVLEKQGFLPQGQVAILRFHQKTNNYLVMEAASTILAEHLAQCNGVVWGTRTFKLQRHHKSCLKGAAITGNDYYQRKDGHPEPSHLRILQVTGLHSVKEAEIYFKKKASGSVTDFTSFGNDTILMRAVSMKAAVALLRRFPDSFQGRSIELVPFFVKQWKEWFQRRDDAVAASRMKIDTPHRSTTKTTTVADDEKYDPDSQNKDNDPPVSTLSKQLVTTSSSSSSAKVTVQLIDGQQHSTSLQEATILKEENDRLKSQLEKLVQLQARRLQQQQPQGAATNNATADTTMAETSKPTGTDEMERLQDEFTNLRNQLQEQDTTQASLRKDLQETKDALTIKSQQLDAVHQSWQEQSVLLQEQAAKLQKLEDDLGKEREQYRELTQSFAKMTNSFDRESNAKRKAEEAYNEERRRHKETKRVLRVMTESTQQQRSQKIEEEDMPDRDNVDI